MSQFTSNKEGFQRAMELCLNDEQDAKTFTESWALPTFYHEMNNQKIEYGPYVAGLNEWRSKMTDYKPVVHQFLRDKDLISARMDGTCNLEGKPVKFESFLFGKVDDTSGRMVHLIERSVWGPVDGPPEHGHI